MLGLLICLSVASPVRSQAQCLEILQQSPSSLSELLQYSGKGINEVGKFEACNRKGWQYFYLTKGQISIGMCTPQECSLTDLSTSLTPLGVSVRATPHYTLSIFGIIYLMLFTSVIGLAIGSTILHSISEKYTSYKIVKCFTGIDALQTLMKRRVNNKFACVNGLKAISFAWVVYGHCFVLKLASSVINFEDVPIDVKSWWAVVQYGGFYAVDIFFCITGLLLSYFLMIELEKTAGKLRFLPMLAHRILRILPTYAFILGFCYFLIPVIGSGPVWSNANTILAEECEKYWWTNFLFINNFIPDGKGNICFGIGWYLANDMQFFLLGPFLVLLYYKLPNKIFAWIFFSLFILALMVVGYLVAYEYNFRVSIFDKMNSREDGADWFKDYYTKPYIRFSPYLQGIMAGILFYHYDRVADKQEITYTDTVSSTAVRVITKTRWGATAIMTGGVALMYAFVVYQRPVYDDALNSDVWSRNTNAIALAGCRVGFVLGLLMFMIPMLMNKAKVVNAVLGNSVFEPIAKISYCGFLIHYGIMIFFNASQYNSMVGGIYTFREWFTFFPLVLIAAIFVFIFVETPFQNAETLILKRGQKS